MLSIGFTSGYLLRATPLRKFTFAIRHRTSLPAVGFVVLGFAVSNEVNKEDGHCADQDDVNITAFVKDKC